MPETGPSAPSRYDTILKLASGGMATVFVGTVRGALGFRQLVAIKKPHPHLLESAAFRSELVAEARLASMIHHANVVDVRDVEIENESISLVMDYIEGASLGELLVAASRAGTKLTPRVAVRIALDALAGLHAAHELVDEKGRFVGLVHRDVSPQNILVGLDGISRVADFGVAKFARKNMASTSDGSLKGKLAYMAPEYVRGEPIDRRFDIFAMGVVLWEALTGKRCFRGENEADTMQRLLTLDPEPVSTLVPGMSAALDGILACALSKDRASRFSNAEAMASALESTALEAGLLAGHGEVANAVKASAGATIEERRALVRGKLANEPSVASLLGVPLEVTSTAATPKQGGGQGAPDTVPDGPTPEASPPTTVAVPTAIPATTLPMTPRMEGAPPHPPSNAASSDHAIANAAPAVRTLASAGPVVAAASTMISSSASLPDVEDGPRAPASVDLDVDPSVVPRPRRWLAPLAVGVVTAALAIAAIMTASSRMNRASPASAPSTVETSASSPVTPSTATAPLSAAVSAPSSTASSTPSARGPSPRAGAKGARPPPSSASAIPPLPLPAAPVDSSRRAPPPNPYVE